MVSSFIALLAAFVAAIAVWDVYLDAKDSVDATISRAVQKLGFEHPIFAFGLAFFAFGIPSLLLFHFWGAEGPVTINGPLAAGLYGAVSGIVVCGGAGWLYWQQPPIVRELIRKVTGS